MQFKFLFSLGMFWHINIVWVYIFFGFIVRAWIKCFPVACVSGNISSWIFLIIWHSLGQMFIKVLIILEICTICIYLPMLGFHNNIENGLVFFFFFLNFENGLVTVILSKSPSTHAYKATCDSTNLFSLFYYQIRNGYRITKIIILFFFFQFIELVKIPPLY